jgi:putative FmdB family regulatory protein
MGLCWNKKKMPLYEFECEDCKTRFERIQKFTDPNPDVCPACGKSQIRRMFSSPAIQFKGSGFYITDYAKKSSPDSSSSSKSSGDKSGGESTPTSSSSGSSDSKSESKSESKSTETKSTETKSSTDSKS